MIEKYIYILNLEPSIREFTKEHSGSEGNIKGTTHSLALLNFEILFLIFL